MKKFDSILTDLKHKSPLNFLYDNGYTPETVKAEIVSTLKPFFKNQDNLEKYAITFLVSDWVQFLKLKAFHPEAEQLITQIVSHYNSAKTKDTISLLTAINNLMPLQLDAGNKFWSILKLELDKSKLEFEEFVQTSMKDISDMVEGLMKVLLYENLAVDRINRGKVIDIEKIKTFELGVIAEELSTNSPFKQLFKIAPENLKVSDWRNISAHQNHKLLPDNKILCEYGPKENRKTITVTRQELFDKVKSIYYTLELLNLAHKLFGFDNLKEIREVKPIPNTNARDEIGFLLFASSIYSQGFEIVDVKYEKDGEAFMTLKDITDGEPMPRGIHASQLAYGLWFIAESKTSTIEYLTKEGKPVLRATATKETCEQIKSGEKSQNILQKK